MSPRTPARVVVYAELQDLNSACLFLTDREVFPTWQLEIQRSLEPEQQDIALGHDSYCVTLPGGATAYGGLLSIQLDPGRLELALSAEFCSTVGLVDPEVEFQLDLSEQDLGLLISGIEAIVAGAKSPPVLKGMF